MSESKLKIDYFITIIGNHENTANYIKELSNGIIVSFGPKDLIFYHNSICINKYRIGINNHYIFELKEYPNKLFIFSDKSITINLKDFSMQIYDRFINCRICFAFNNYLFTYLEKRTYLEKILWPELSVPIGIHILNKLYWTGINLNNRIIALTSNKILSKGEDIIIFFNMNIRKIDFFIKNYSFTLSQNNLALIPGLEHKKSNKILLCACKKYQKNQKNGILLLKLTFNHLDVIVSQTFYETKNFEVYCFCHIWKSDKNMIFETKMIETEYFLVGGLSLNKKKGLIKLYKINYKYNFEKTEIEYVNDIEIKDKIIYNFKGIITSIIQPKLREDFLNIQLFIIS